MTHAIKGFRFGDRWVEIHTCGGKYVNAAMQRDDGTWAELDERKAMLMQNAEKGQK